MTIARKGEYLWSIRDYFVPFVIFIAHFPSGNPRKRQARTRMVRILMTIARKGGYLWSIRDYFGPFVIFIAPFLSGNPRKRNARTRIVRILMTKAQKGGSMGLWSIRAAYMPFVILMTPFLSGNPRRLKVRMPTWMQRTTPRRANGRSSCHSCTFQTIRDDFDTLLRSRKSKRGAAKTKEVKSSTSGNKR